uniref:3-isopropylmalate dehydratase n=1 Tax=Caulobacter sp. (strain K31) TaxID=366602 RepID=B0T6M4_CAUSK
MALIKSGFDAGRASDQRPRTMQDKLWDAHVVRDLGGGWSLLHIDRHIIHDLSGPVALAQLEARGLPVRNRELTFATPDHAVSSLPGRTGATYPPGERLWAKLKAGSEREGIRFFDTGTEGQGIVHVMGPELGLALPGMTLICGDSHTCTNGGIGALAFGVGQSESMHALATQCLRLRRPLTMRINIDGVLGLGVTAKDVALHLLRRLGTSGGLEHTIEYAGSTVRAMGVEARLTLCNLTVELGARSGFVAADDTTFAYVDGRPFAPKGAAFDRAVALWRGFASDDEARFDREISIDAADIAPTLTWGVTPEQVISVDGRVPDPSAVSDETQREAMVQALDYMGLTPGQALTDAVVDWVFIGSCANSRLSDLRAAAQIAKGRRVAAGVTAWVVPGSEIVKRAAEAEGLDKIFLDAGFAWREPGCSMCVAANGETVPPGARAVSTSNRNFVGRQGPRARTHLASPATAVASAIRGKIADVRAL